jgi:carboxyl-terminal processing protease
MKRSLFFTLTIVFAVQTIFAQTFKNKTVKDLLDSTIVVMQQHAINAKTVNWAQTKENAYKMAANLNNPYEMGDVTRYLYACLKDFHGKFSYRDSDFQWHGKPVANPDSVLNQWKIRAGIKTQLLANDIGYIKVPSMSGQNIKELNIKAQGLNDSLCTLLAHNIKGIILDLRINGGGAMFPMILGLEQLLGNGKVGEFVGDKDEVWLIKNNRFYVDTALRSAVVPKLNINASAIPVVILTSPATGSSGEFLVIAFKGRKNTILLGSKTAGYVTSTNGFYVDNKMGFALLSVGYGKDRTGKGYKEALEPDIALTAVDKFNDIKNDEKVKAAMKWITAH